MSIRSTTKARRGVASAATAALLALAVTGCGADDGKKPESKAPVSSASERAETTNQPSTAGGQAEEKVVLAEVKGAGGLVLKINQAQRDGGGFVTVSGIVTNESDIAVSTNRWVGNEIDMVNKSPNSVAGATLVDRVGKKRYYILRDTDGRCLCTTGVAVIVPDKPTEVFMQFPAPPETVKEVDFTLPTFATATIQISG